MKASTITIIGIVFSGMLAGCVPPPKPNFPHPSKIKTPRDLHEHNMREAERGFDYMEANRPRLKKTAPPAPGYADPAPGYSGSGSGY